MKRGKHMRFAASSAKEMVTLSNHKAANVPTANTDTWSRFTEADGAADKENHGSMVHYTAAGTRPTVATFADNEEDEEDVKIPARITVTAAATSAMTSGTASLTASIPVWGLTSSAAGAASLPAAAGILGATATTMTPGTASLAATNPVWGLASSATGAASIPASAGVLEVDEARTKPPPAKRANPWRSKQAPTANVNPENFVLEVFPDASIDHVRRLLAAYGQNATSVVSKMLNNDNYPRNEAQADSVIVTTEQDVEVEKDGTTMECPNCCDWHPIDQMIPCREAHVFCRTCVETFAKNQIFGNNNLGVHRMTKKLSLELQCLQYDCQSHFERVFLKRALPQRLLQHYDSVQLKLNIASAGLSDTVYACPKCGTCIVEVPIWQNFVQCPVETCRFASCRDCGEAAHMFFGYVGEHGHVQKLVFFSRLQLCSCQ
jgi:hypothetical protein